MGAVLRKLKTFLYFQKFDFCKTAIPKRKCSI